jgi:hypothetical protein
MKISEAAKLLYFRIYLHLGLLAILFDSVSWPESDRISRS